MKVSWKKRIIGLLLAVFMLCDTTGLNIVYAQEEVKDDSTGQSGETEEGNQEERQAQEEPNVEENAQAVEQDIPNVETYKGWEYFVDENNCVHITSYQDITEINLQVPVRIRKKPVTAIEEGAFQNLKVLEKINISMYVTDIGENIFSNANVSINAYHGTYALDYAITQGINYTNLSEYDFASGVIDMTEIIPMNYSFVDMTDIRMNLLEAGQFKEGSVFYLPPSDDLPNGDAFRILHIEETTDSQVILRCERAIGGEAVNSLHIENEKLLPDWDNAVYYYDTDVDGEYEEYSYEEIQPYIEISGNVSSDPFSRTFKDDFELAGKNDFVTGKIKAGYNLTFGITATANIDMEIGLSDISVETFDIGIEETADGNVYLEGSCSADVPIAEIPLTSIGVATAYAELSLHCSAEGKISCRINYTAKQGLKYDSASQQIKPYSKFSKDGLSEGTVNAEVGLQLELGVNVIFLGDIVKADAGIGIGASYKQSSKHKECADTSVSLYAKITAGTDFSGVPGEFAKKLSVTFTILDKKYPLSDEHFEKVNGQMQCVSHCKYLSHEVDFYTGKSFTVSPQFPDNNEKVVRPEITESQCAGDTLLGWNTGEGTAYWDFDKNVVTEDMTLFAVWASDINSKKTVTFKAEGSPDFYERYVPGAHIAEPSAPKRMNYIFQGWFKDESFVQKFDFANSVMPGQDITLYGKWKFISGYNPWDLKMPLISDNKFEYQIINDEVIITKCNMVTYGIIIPEKIEGYPVVEIADGVFQGKSAITSITIPDSVKRLGNSCFSNCSKLKKVEGANGLEKIGHNCFYQCSVLSGIKIAGTVVQIGSRAFYGCYALEEISLPDNLTEISYGCFEKCTSLNRVQLPNSTEIIGESAFYNCSSLQNIDLPKSVKTIKSRAFSNCRLIETANIPDGVEEIGDSAFGGCSKLADISLPNTIEYIAENAFSSTAWYEGQSDGLLYLDGYVFGVKGALAENSRLHIKEGTFCVTDSAFQGNKDIISIQFPSSLQRIGSYAFEECVGLKKVNFPERLNRIESYAFRKCNGLENIIFSGDLNHIGDEAFEDCNNLRNFTLPSTLESIGNRAFSECHKITEIRFPENLKSVGYDAFGNCVNLNKIVYDSGEVNGDYSAFYGAGKNTGGIALIYSGKVKNIPERKNSYGIDFSRINILSIEIGENVESIGSHAFHYSSYAENMKVYFNAKRCMRIAENAFSKFSSLEIGSGVTRIPDQAFYKQSDLSDIKFIDENSLIYIGDRAFHDTKWKENLDSTQKGAYYIGHCLYQYYGSYQGKDITFREGTTMICYDALSGQRGINSVLFPSTIKYIGGEAFAGMDYVGSTPSTSDPEVNLDFSHTDLEYIGDRAFYNVFTGGILFNKKIDYIGKEAFLGTGSMISIPEYMTELNGEYNYFYSMYIPETVTSISKIAFCESEDDAWNGIRPKRYLYCKKGSYAEQYAKEHDYPCYYVFDEYPYLALSEDKTHLMDFMRPTKEIVLPDSVTSYDQWAFGKASQISIPEDKINYDSVESLTIKNNEQTGINFRALTNLKTLIIGKKVTKLAYGLIQQFPNLERVQIESGNQNYKVENDFVMSMDGEELLFYNGQKAEVHVPKSVRYIYNNAFLNKGNIQVIIEADVRLAERGAFKGSRPTIYDVSGSFFEEYARDFGFGFQELAADKKASYCWCDAGGSVLSLNKETGHLALCAGTTYYMEGEKNADKFIKEYGEKVKSLFVERECLKKTGYDSINKYCNNLEQIKVDGNNTMFQEKDNILYYRDSGDVDSYMAVCSVKNITEARLIKNTSYICDMAFYECKKLKYVEIPNGITRIRDGVFRGCSSLQNIELPDSVRLIEDLAFSNSGLKTIHLPKSLTHIGFNAFVGCNIESITIPYTVDYIDNSAFDRSSLKNVFGMPGSYAQTWAEKNGYLFNLATIDQEGVYQNFIYKIQDGEAVIVGLYDVQSGISVKIPEKIANIPVTKIGEGAFCGNTKIQSLMIPAGIREIGNGAMESMSSLNKITVDKDNQFYSSEGGVLFNKDKTELLLYPQDSYNRTYSTPDSVKVIAKRAFENCKIGILVLNSGLEKIGDKAFYNSSRLSTVTIPETVKEIGIWAFWNATNLKMRGPVGQCAASDYAQQYNIPYNNYTVKMVNRYTTCIKFEQKAGSYIENPLKDISRDDYTLNGWYTDRECTVPWDFANNPMPEEDLTLYAGWVCDYQYESCDGGICITGTNKNTKYYTIPSKLDGKNVIAIAGGAFEREDISAVHIPSSVTDIAENAFHKGIIIYADEGSAAEQYAREGDYDFAYQYYTVKFQSNGGSTVKTYSYRKGSLIKEPVEPIKDNYVFKGWYKNSALGTKWDFGTDIMPDEDIILYAGWNKINEAIPDNEFLYAEEDNKIVLKGYNGNSDNIVIPKSINGIEVKEIGDMFLQNNDKAVSIVIPEGIEKIGVCAFEGCSGLSKITMPDTVENIGEQAFSGCISLKSIVLPADLRLIQDGVFSGCTGLRKISIPDSVSVIGESAFEDCKNITEIAFGSGITVIGEKAFYNCKGIQKVTIPQSVQAIGEDSFTGCKKLENIFVASGNEVYKDMNGVLLNAVGSQLIRYPQGRTDETFKIPEDVKQIGTGAFSYNRFLKEIEMTEGVEYLGDRAFYSCTNLDNIELSKTALKELAKNVMAKCKKLRTCSLPVGLESIEDGAFLGCNLLGRLKIPETVIRIVSDSFDGCDSLVIECDENSFAYQYAIENQLDFYYYPKAPEAPQIMSRRATSIVLKEDERYEYSLDGQKWQTSNVFRNLQMNTDYIFYQRVAASEKNAASPVSPGTSAATSSYKTSASEFEISLQQEDFVYTGKEIMPTARVMWKGVVLEKDVDYTISYYDCINAGKAKIVLSGIGDFEGETQTEYEISKATQLLSCTNVPEYITVGDNYQLEMKSQETVLEYRSEDSSIAAISSEGIIKGLKTGNTTICVIAPETENFLQKEIKINISVRKEISACTISMDKMFFQYDGEEKQPVISVYDDSVLLKADVDYVISDFTDDKCGVGQKSFSIEGKGDYIGQKTARYYIYECTESEDWETLESEHNYADDTCTMWSFKAGDDVSSFEIVFDEKTYFEEGCDYLYLYTYDDELIDEYTGDELSGMSIPVHSNGVKLLLYSDESGTEWGFKVSHIRFEIKASAGEGGEITPNGNVTVQAGESQTFAVQADPGYLIKDVLVDGESIGAVTSYIFENVTKDHTIQALFQKTQGDKVSVEKITLNHTESTITVGTTLELKAQVVPVNATNAALRWSSSDNGVASVSPTGVVTAHKAGTSTITVLAQDGSGVSASCKVTVIKTGQTEQPNTPGKTVQKVGTVLTDVTTKAKYKVMKSGTVNGNVVGNAEVEYVKPATKVTSVKIPNTVKIDGVEYKVVSIASNAFKNNKKLTTVKMGSNLRTIGSGAFSGCKKLKNVTIGKNVTAIKDKAFYKCIALSKIIIPSKVKKIGKQAFCNCSKLKSITIKTSKLTVKNVGSKAFKGIYKKSTIKVPKKKLSSYKKLLKKKSIPSKAKIRK